eukprot:5621148-Pleurochrysis_carterae.AAC.1
MGVHESRACRSAMHGTSQMGPCRACMKNGEATCPLSAGCSSSPKLWSRSRTGGGPPSGTLPAKKRLTEIVEHGGEATIAVYAPTEQRSSRRVYTESNRRSCLWVSPVRRPVTVALRGGALRVLRSL